jgi:hypothetical protein
LEYLRQFEDITVISGGAKGADSLAVRAAKHLGFVFREYYADWYRFGKAAGPLRNQRMLDLEDPDLVVAFHEDIDSSKGTKDMVRRALNRGVEVAIVG